MGMRKYFKNKKMTDSKKEEAKRRKNNKTGIVKKSIREAADQLISDFDLVNN